MNELRVENGRDFILLSWSPPFSHNVSGMDPDIWYTVLISNVTDEDNQTAVLCTDCHNLTKLHYTFTTAKPNPCHEYSFTVIPQNGVGEGSRSGPMIGYFTTGIILKKEMLITFEVLNFYFLYSDPPSINSSGIEVYSNQKSLGKNEFTILLPVSNSKIYILFFSYSLCLLTYRN